MDAAGCPKEPTSNSYKLKPMGRDELRSTEDEYCINAQCGGMHLVVFGNAGSGKSSLCKQLGGVVDDLVFPVDQTLKAVTNRPKDYYAQQHGHTFTVLDTPGRDSDTDSAQRRLDLQKLIKSLRRHIKQDDTTPPGHVHSSVSTRKTCKAIFVVCVRCDARYAGDEHKTYLELKKLWGDDEDFSERLVVAFTRGDTLTEDSDPKVTSVTETTAQEGILEEMLNRTLPELKQLIRDAGGDRYILFNNKEGHKDERAVMKLLDMVDTMEGMQYKKRPSHRWCLR